MDKSRAHTPEHRDHAWVGSDGGPWSPELESDDCAQCGDTPDCHPYQEPVFGGHAFGWGDAINPAVARLLNDLEQDGAITIHDESLQRYIKSVTE